MDRAWPVTEKGEILVALGTHWRVAWVKAGGLRMKMKQYGHYYWRQCWRGFQLRFHVEMETPALPK